MYPARFDYGAPTTVDEVLVERGDEAKVLAGGQSPSRRASAQIPCATTCTTAG